MNLSEHDIDATVCEALHAEVDHVEADDELLDRIRRGAATAPAPSRTGRAVWGAAAAVVLVAGAAVGLDVLAFDDGTSVVAGHPDDREAPPMTEPPEDGPLAFEVLEEGGASEAGVLHAAVDDASLRRLWRRMRFGTVLEFPGDELDDLPDIDFEEKVVVQVTSPPRVCPPELTAMERHGDEVRVRFEDVAPDCDQPAMASTFVIALERDDVVPGFTLVLPASPADGIEEQRLRVDVPEDPADAPPLPPARPSAPIVVDGECRGSNRNSPARFSDETGTYAAWLGLERHLPSTPDLWPDHLTLVFKDVRWLVGDDARAAARAAGSATPRDSYVDTGRQWMVRGRPVAPDAEIALVRRSTTGEATLERATQDELVDHLRDGAATELGLAPELLNEDMTTVFWLTFHEGMVIGICEQHRP